jgi:hypothetical protein
LDAAKITWLLSPIAAAFKSFSGKPQ